MHGILIGGTPSFKSPLTGKNIPTIKRAAGAYRLASFLRQHDWDIEVLDYFPAWEQDELEEFFESRVTSKTKFIGFSVVFPATPESHIKYTTFISWFRKKYPDVLIIAGAKNLYPLMHLDADYFATGYGEYALLEILSGNPKYQTITEYGKSIKWVNADITYPAFPFKDLSVMYERRDFLEPTEFLTLELSRGCKFKCKFCSYNAIGLRGDYTRDMPSLYDELKRNYESWGISNYSCADETINDTTDKLRAVAEQTNKLNFDLNLSGYVRGDLFASRPQDWEYMQEMGLWAHYYGIESFNAESSKSIGKGMNPDKLKDGLKEGKKHFLKTGKYRSSYSMIIGLPGETEETFDDGINWINKEMPDSDIIMFPLMIAGNTDTNLKNNFSEIDLTWKNSKFYSEGSIDKWGLSEEELKRDNNSELIETPYDFLTNDAYFLWENKDMNLYDAYKIYEKYFCNAEWRNKMPPNIWLFYEYCTFQQHKLSDMNKPAGQLDVNPELHENFFNQYKLKKLSL